MSSMSRRQRGTTPSRVLAQDHPCCHHIQPQQQQEQQAGSLWAFTERLVRAEACEPPLPHPFHLLTVHQAAPQGARTAAAQLLVEGVDPARRQAVKRWRGAHPWVWGQQAAAALHCFLVMPCYPAGNPPSSAHQKQQQVRQTPSRHHLSQQGQVLASRD
jgi:hypothetical protein